MVTKISKQQQRREASYSALVDAAMHQFADHGYAATRVEDISRAAGHTSGAFYFHFTNKLDCFWAVIDHREALRGDWVTYVTADLAPGTSLRSVLEVTFAHFAAVEAGVGAWVLVMVEFSQQNRHDPAIRACLGEVYAGWHANLVRFVSALQRAGLVERGRDPDLLATQVFAYVEGLTAHGQLYGLDPARFGTALFDGLDGILGAASVSDRHIN